MMCSEQHGMYDMQCIMYNVQRVVVSNLKKLDHHNSAGASSTKDNRDNIAHLSTFSPAYQMQPLQLFIRFKQVT